MTATYLVAYPHPHIPQVNRILPCEVTSGTRGTQLIKQLIADYPEYSEDLKSATLWKSPNIPTSDVDNESMTLICERIKQRHSKFTMIANCKAVEHYFPCGPQEPSGDWVDVVVVTPEVMEYADHGGDADGNLRHMKARAALSRAMRISSPPSVTIKNPTAIKSAMENPTGPRYGRPSNRFGPPTALFSRPLALLRYDLEHLDGFTPSSTDADHAFYFIEKAANFFGEEDEREVALWSILGVLLAGERQWRAPVGDGSAKPYGVWLEGPFAYLIVEMKNDSGLGGDPFLQGLFTYSKIIAQEKYCQFLERSNLPVVLLAVAGNHLVVSTVIFTDSVYADESVSVKLHFGPYAPDNVLRIARTFMAINQCTARLRVLYGNLKRSAERVPPAKVLWPNPTADPPESTEGVEGLHFYSKVDRVLGTPINQTPIDEENRRHAMYLARTHTEGRVSTTDVLVKFTVKYNAAAHHLLASHDPPLAPTLYSCKRVIGDMFMVVMQYIPESEGTSLCTRSLLPPSALKIIQQDVSHALELLHRENFVFGDLRESNILYLPNKGRALLVDFDSVGQDKKDRYSACLNPEAGLGVVRLQIMEKSHDAKNLQRLIDRLSRRLVQRQRK